MAVFTVGKVFGQDVAFDMRRMFSDTNADAVYRLDQVDATTARVTSTNEAFRLVLTGRTSAMSASDPYPPRSSASAAARRRNSISSNRCLAAPSSPAH